MCKLRCANIKLPVYNIILMFHTDICGLCNLCLPSDEYHYVLICFYDHSRKLLIKPYFYNRPNIMKFNILLSSSNEKIMYKLANLLI